MDAEHHSREGVLSSTLGLIVPNLLLFWPAIQLTVLSPSNESGLALEREDLALEVEEGVGSYELLWLCRCA